MDMLVFIVRSYAIIILNFAQKDFYKIKTNLKTSQTKNISRKLLHYTRKLKKKNKIQKLKKPGEIYITLMHGWRNTKRKKDLLRLPNGTDSNKQNIKRKMSRTLVSENWTLNKSIYYCIEE